MLKRTIQYEDFNGNNIIEDFYFNLSKSELIELEVEYDGGLGQALQRIVANNDLKNLIAEMKKIVLLSYGKKSEDGKRFIKTEELRAEFAQTPAYDTLFMELATNDNAASAFIQGIIPKDMGDAVLKAQNEQLKAVAIQGATQNVDQAVAQAAATFAPPSTSIDV
jgi:hypothetical protein